MLVYRVDSDKTAPVEVECEVFKYPHTDAEGYTIYLNTHFASEDEAWQKLLREQKAGVHLNAMSLTQAQAEAQKWTEKTARWAQLWSQTDDNYRQWQQKQEG